MSLGPWRAHFSQEGALKGKPDSPVRFHEQHDKQVCGNLTLGNRVHVSSELLT